MLFRSVAERTVTFVAGVAQGYEVSVYCPEAQHFVAIFEACTTRQEPAPQGERYREVLDSVADAVFVIDVTTEKILEVNATGLKYSGYALEEFTKSVHGASHGLRTKSDREAMREGLAKCRDSGEATFEVSAVSRSGSVSMVEFSIKAVEISGTPVFVAVGREISARIETERRLVRGDYLLERIYGSMTEGLVFQDVQGKIVSANKAALKYLGLSLEQLLNRTSVDPAWGSVHEDGSPWPGETHPSMVSLRSGKGTLGNVMGIDDPQTGRRWISINSVPLFGATGKNPDGVFTTFVDITEAKARERELQLTRQRYQLIFEHSGSANVLFDQDCRLVAQNSAAIQYTQRQEESSVGKTVEQLFGPERGSEIRSRMVEAIVKRLPVTTERGYMVGTQHLWLQSVIAPLFQPETQQAAGTQVTIRDVTSERLLEDKASELQKLESLGFLAGGIAHEFNNILSVLFGNIELALRGLAAGKPTYVKEKLDAALATFDMAKNLTRENLTFATGGTPVKKVMQLLGRLRSWAEASFTGSSVTLVSDFEPDLWECNCDADQVRQVLGYLLDNARQASAEGVTVRLVATNVPDPVPTVRLSVVDQGIGIDEVGLKQVFAPFYTTRPGATGLGLTKALSIAKKHGGWIEVLSEPKHGSTFTLVLPALAPSKPVAEPPVGVNYHGSGWALVMDDQDQVRELVAEMLELLGFQVLSAPDGQSGLRLFQEAGAKGHTIRFALLDLTVPGGMGGLEMGKALLEFGASPVLVAMSGYAADGDQTEFDKVFRARLPKPFSASMLMDTLQALLPSVS